MVNFSIEDMIFHTLTTLQKKKKTIILKSDDLLAFSTAKVDFTKLSFIQNDPQTKILLITVIKQELKSQRKPIALFSVKLSPTQTR